MPKLSPFNIEKSIKGYVHELDWLKFTKIYNFEFSKLSEVAVTLKCDQGHQ